MHRYWPESLDQYQSLTSSEHNTDGACEHVTVTQHRTIITSFDVLKSSAVEASDITRLISIKISNIRLNKSDNINSTCGASCLFTHPWTKKENKKVLENCDFNPFSHECTHARINKWREKKKRGRLAAINCHFSECWKAVHLKASLEISLRNWKQQQQQQQKE